MCSPKGTLQVCSATEISEMPSKTWILFIHLFVLSCLLGLSEPIRETLSFNLFYNHKEISSFLLITSRFQDYSSQLLRLLQIGGSGVLVSDLTYIFEEETPRWRRLLSELGL